MKIIKVGDKKEVWKSQKKRRRKTRRGKRGWKSGRSEKGRKANTDKRKAVKII